MTTTACGAAKPQLNCRSRGSRRAGRSLQSRCINQRLTDARSASDRSRVAAQCAAPHAPLASLFQERHISGKGLGLIAARDVPAGTAVLEEQAVLSITAPPAEEWDVLRAAVKALSEHDRGAYYRLANSFDAQHPAAYGVYLTNGFRTSTPGAEPRHGVFCQLSRANHSCLANCAVSTHGGHSAVLRAATDVAAGQELTLCYLKGLATSARVVRREGLQRGFNFVCGCEACSAPPEQAADSDARRARLRELDSEVCAALDSDRFAAALQGMEDRLWLLDAEGIADPRIRTTTCWDALRVCRLAPQAGSVDESEWGRRLLAVSRLADGAGGAVARALERFTTWGGVTSGASGRLVAALAAGGQSEEIAEARGALWGEDGGLLREQLPTVAEILN